MISRLLNREERKTKNNGTFLAAGVSGFLTSAVLLSGCSNMTTTATDNSSVGAAAKMIGAVHGGNQPVAFAQVSLYAAGKTGHGSPATLLATTTTANDGAGSFSFVKSPNNSQTFPNTGNTYSCGTGVDPLIYIVSRGGNTTGAGDSTVQNSAAVFVAPVGNCSAINSSTRVDITEVTTAATATAAGQFINPSTDDIGNDGINVSYIALTNAFKNVFNLVNMQTGLANTTSTAAGTGTASGVTVTITPEAAKLNTVANILSACINQTTATNGSGCTTLFANAVPPANAARTSQPGATFATPTDTLQAALFMFLNPTDGSTANRTALYNLAPAAGAPYQPTLTAVPTDWTVALTYTSASTCGTGSSVFLNQPYDLNVDANGNVWLANSLGTNNALVELSSTGTPSGCVTLGGSSKGGGVVDIAGNVWYGDSVNNFIYRYQPSSNTVRTYTTAGPVLSVTTDGSGNVFFTSLTGSTGSVYVIGNGANTDGINSPVQISNTVGPLPARIFPDKNNNLWVSSGSNFVTELNQAAGGANLLNGYTSTFFTVPSPSYGLIVGPNNRVYVTSQNPSATLTILAPSGATYAIQSGFPTAANTGGLSNPTGLYIDGAQDSWVSNNTANSSNGAFGISEIAVDGTAISASGNTNGSYQKPAPYFNAMRGTLIDQAGNVWVTNDATPNSVTEILGAAVPVYGPYSIGLQQAANGRFMTLP